MRMPEPVRMPEPEVGMRSPQRVPVPAFVLEEDEPARNAAAARAVGFELDSMLAQFPSNPYRKDSLKPDQSPEQRSSSPLAPPEAPFARPQPVLDMARVPSIDPPQYSPPRSPVIARSNLSGGSNNRQSSLFSGSQPSRPAFTRPGGTGPLPQGSRTISAAAFKRPAARRDSVGSAEQQSNIDSTPPLHFQKRVSSGQPAQASSSPWARTTLPLPPHETTDDEEFDYVGAYSQDSQYVRDDAGLR
ncbi:hypothetical protein FISHEDRAFT_77660 [Fistulina hepatica ATCC 64428]|uniref:Uncharacterized protein n=1 Tax=Fistulina hepatica ATCC 64428 TaxID=1128425 RepID=A0A0D7A271_9AGAR|nr:hypothetical protein FISHEDRAFT_77660 [Fistulina hepatica ATCC 64428]